MRLAAATMMMETGESYCLPTRIFTHRMFSDPAGESGEKLV
jgi:hypothetical protein